MWLGVLPSNTERMFSYLFWRLVIHKQPAYSLEPVAQNQSIEIPYSFVCILLFVEDRTEAETRASLDFIIMVNTLKTYTNEEREKTSFEQVLRPIYQLFH